MNTLRKKILYVVILSFIVLVIVVASSRKDSPDIEHTYSKVLMGTLVELTLSSASDNGEPYFREAAQAAFAEISRLESVFSSYKSESDISKISRNAGKGAVKVSAEVIEVVEIALKISKLSGGAFDPTIGSLGKLWSFSGEKKEVPTKASVAEALKLVDYNQIYIDNGSVGIRGAKVRMNLGGIAKGYIVGKAVGVLRSRGIERMIVKAGGDMFVFSSKGSVPFEIGIMHPRVKDKFLSKLKLANGAIATSGDYERFFIADGVRYHHIIDPKTGFPARRSISSTVTSINPALADALSTALFVMGHREGIKMIESIEGVEALVVDSQGKLFVSSGFDGLINVPQGKAPSGF